MYGTLATLIAGQHMMKARGEAENIAAPAAHASSEHPGIKLESVKDIDTELARVRAIKAKLETRQQEVAKELHAIGSEENGNEFDPNPPAIANDPHASALQALGQEDWVLESQLQDAAACERDLVAAANALESETPVGGMGQVIDSLPKRLQSLYERTAETS